MHRLKLFQNNYTVWILALIIGAALLLRLLFWVGIVGSDDVSIANNSLRLLQSGPYVPHSHYSARIGLIYPQAVLFSLFGVGEWQFTVIPLLSSLAGVWLAYLIAGHYGGQKTGFLAAALLAIFPLDTYFSTQLMPDLPLGASLALAFYLLLKSGRLQSKGALWAIGAGLIWGVAYLIKVEAFFFLFVVFAMGLAKQITWRNLLWSFLAVGVVVLSEHLVYWIASGDPLLRLHVATVQVGGKTTHEYSMTQLWVFPKAWFLTPYYFGLYYYLTFLAVLWSLWRRIPEMLPILTWIIIFLLWLQYGGNPFSDNYVIKSHLQRYCNMINVPVVVIVSIFLIESLKRISSKTFIMVLLFTVFVSLALIPFNQLSSERQISTKKLLSVVKKEQYYPLYLDRVSFDLATMYLYDDAEKGLLHSLQKHNFKTMQTQLLGPEDVAGFLLINHGFVDYGYNRYRVNKISTEDYADTFEVIGEVNNPANPMSYFSAKLFRWVAGFIPLEFFRNKIQHTASSLLEGHDAVLMAPKLKGEK